MRQAAIEQLQAVLAELGLDGALISNTPNRFYLSGFSAGDHGPSHPDAVLLVGSQGPATLLTGQNEVSWAAAESEGEVLLWSQPWQASVVDVIAQCRWTKVGAEEGSLSYSAWLNLAGRLDGTVELLALGDHVRALRAIKSTDELAIMRTALELTDRAFAAAHRQFADGMSEAEAANIVKIELLRGGAEGEAFPTIVASGPHAARPHHRPGDRRLREGEPIIIDMGARWKGYAGDLTRTICLGEPDEMFRSVYNVVLNVQKRALEMIAPGRAGVDIDAQARSVIDAKYEGALLHGLGHGLGIEVHEAPRLSKTSTDTLEPGHVVTVEPGIYLSDWGGVRIEDVVVVTDSGCENLTRSAKLAV